MFGGIEICMKLWQRLKELWNLPTDIGNLFVIQQTNAGWVRSEHSEIRDTTSREVSKATSKISDDIYKAFQSLNSGLDAHIPRIDKLGAAIKRLEKNRDSQLAIEVIQSPKDEDYSFRVRLNDGVEFDAHEIAKLVFDGREYRFYDKGGELVVRTPKSSVACVQRVYLTQPANETAQKEAGIDSAGVNPEVRKKLFDDAKRVGQRFFCGRFDEGKGYLFDTESDDYLVFSESGHPFMKKVLEFANSKDREDKLKGREPRDPTVNINITDIDKEPVVVMEEPIFRQGMQQGEYSPIMAPAVEKGDMQYRFDIKDGKAELRRCVVTVDGGKPQKVNVEVANG